MMQDGMFDENYSNHNSLAELHFKRAIGEIPEMESSKAMAGLIRQNFKLGGSIADIGCSSGHYLYSILKYLKKEDFSYTGIELHDLLLNKAKLAWQKQENASFRKGSIFQIPADDSEFDLVFCSNLLMHLPSIVQPVSELLRIAKERIVIRTYIGTKSYKIQEVKNNSFWPGTSVAPENEFYDDGTARFFEYENIWGMDYFSSVVKRFAPNAKITYVKDTFYDPAAIEETANTAKLPNPTRTLDGIQIFDYIICPYHFIIIDKS